MLRPDIKSGDYVIRMLGGPLMKPMVLRVTHVTVAQIICGSWTFDKATGAEIDEDLNWGPPPLHTGSYIKGPVKRIKELQEP